MKKTNKQAQTQLSFGMIFSIILIIAFISFAVYGIAKFLDTVNFAKVEKFKNDFQADIERIWKGSGTSQEVDYLIPKKIKQVCFADDDYKNMYFAPLDLEYEGILLEHVNFEETLKHSRGTPKKLCIATSDGQIYMTIKNSYGESLVTIS